MLNKILINIFIVCSFLIITCEGYSQNSRAMWIWNRQNQIYSMIIDYSSYRDNLFEFCSAPHGDPDHRISVLFLDCKSGVYDNQDKLRNFISEASDSGITIEYLDGDPTWATYNRETGFERIQKAIEFNAATLIDKEKIKGIQFDVEPYLLKESRGYMPPYYDVERMVVWNLFVTFVDSCQKIIDSAKTDLYFGIAIPRWYENHVGEEELKRLQEKVDYVAIMDYNENSDVIIRDAENEINNANELSKKVWIGVETKEVTPETVSFFEEGVTFMESQLDSVLNVYGNNPDFLGIAIHSYTYYKSLFVDPVSVDEINYEIKNGFILEQNYPNPFNPSTKIKFYLDKAGYTSLNIYNILGEQIKSLLDKNIDAGWHELTFNSSKFSSGIYIYELISNNYKSRKKMVLTK
ncbi:MAG: T9SS type A sorting domain-containing protein [Bacteroidetes bacterium]|nr:T9SS type A sorting domain-containing protein [Bacteroidota bacterium]MBU1798771.1 T9SS type A sorting domain-containing protein [Bacteroidota bacterium]